jgi:hypothetical protein
VPVTDLDQTLNRHHAPWFETSANSGRGVFEALKSITTLVLTDLRRRGVWREAADATAPAPGELRDEPSDPALSLSKSQSSTDGIAASLQALADSHEPPQPDTRELAPLRPEDGPVDGGVLARGAQLSEILPPGVGRDAIVAVEYLVHRGDFARAVLRASKVFQETAATSTALAAGGHEGPALHALMLGIPGERYLRFRETAARAASGSASSADALFALFFLVDVVLRR